VSKAVHKCPACSRRVKRAPYIALKDRNTRRETRYHGALSEANLGCLEAAAAEAERRGADEIILAFYHSRACGDPAGKMSCRGGCFAVGIEEEEGGGVIPIG
jgi:hypothetical protein